MLYSGNKYALFSEHVYLTRSFLFHLFSVTRAKALSQEVKNDSQAISRVIRVFKLEILETFKGVSILSKTEGIHVNGSGQHSLFAKAYTKRDEGACGVWLSSGTIYLLGGYIRKGKLQLSWCSLNKKWSQVTPDQRVGIRRVYGQNCECQISPCRGDGCGKLKGCADDWEQGSRTYCVKNADGTACSWHDTAPSWRDSPATSKATNMSFYFPLLYLLIFLNLS